MRVGVSVSEGGGKSKKHVDGNAEQNRHPTNNEDTLNTLISAASQ
jgi:hypothetical protein